MIAINGLFKFLGVVTVLAGVAYFLYRLYDRKYISNIVDDRLDFNDDDYDLGIDMDFDSCDCNCSCAQIEDEQDDYLTYEEIVAAEGFDEIIE